MRVYETLRPCVCDFFVYLSSAAIECLWFFVVIVKESLINVELFLAKLVLGGGGGVLRV